jgi:protease I
MHCASRSGTALKVFCRMENDFMKTNEHNLAGKKVAILATDGFEQDELFSPLEALKAANADVKIVAPHDAEIKAWKHTDWGKKIAVDMTLTEAHPEDFDALVLPGGVINPDQLRREPQAVQFVKTFFDSGKPVAAICHGPQMLIEANVVRGRKLTSFASIKTDLKNAGAEWVDQEVVVDNGLVTSRSPDDLPAFNAKMIEEISEGVHPRGRSAMAA